MKCRIGVVGFMIVAAMALPYKPLMSQDYDKPPIGSEDFERGLNNMDYIRPILLEKGFSLAETDSQGEYWRVWVSKDAESKHVLSTGRRVVGCQVQLSSVKNGDTELGRVIFVQIRRDILPLYAQRMTDEVRKYYPEKKAEKITTREGNKKNDNYRLIYYRSASSIEVEFEEDESWTRFYFRLVFQ